MRAGDDRVVAGVAGGVGRYLGVDPNVVRLALVVLTFANGLGAVLYLVGWALLPDEDPAAPPPPARPPTAERAVGLGLLTLGTVLLFGRAGLVLPAGHRVGGRALRDRVRARVGPHRRGGPHPRPALAGRRLAACSSSWGSACCSRRAACCPPSAASAWSSLATGIGVALLLGPWIVRLWSDLGTERRERIRSEERSEIAAHLHDSVLQTLALIQRAEAPGRARTLARRQERELRAWLFDERPPDGDGDVTTISAALEHVVTDVEDRHDVEVDLVARRRRARWSPARGPRGRGARGGPQRRPPLGGARGVPSTWRSSRERVTAYVRDRGKGFDLDAVEPGRVGVRESIIGRMARHGGRAEVHTAPDDGTEVVLEVPPAR